MAVPPGRQESGIRAFEGAKVVPLAVTLGFFSNLFGGITHYGTGPAPIFFGSRYVDLGTWWRLGVLVSVINILIWLGLGGLWCKILGYW
jgi:DASS family divalent anion:Na+ symporter